MQFERGVLARENRAPYALLRNTKARITVGSVTRTMFRLLPPQPGNHFTPSYEKMYLSYYPFLPKELLGSTFQFTD